MAPGSRADTDSELGRASLASEIAGPAAFLVTAQPGRDVKPYGGREKSPAGMSVRGGRADLEGGLIRLQSNVVIRDNYEM